MLRTATTNLPPEQRQRLHPEFVANEADYLRMRDSLLSQYRGQWVAVQGAQVIAASESLQTVTEKAAAAGGHPYIAFVGGEDNVVFRVRRAEFVFDGPAEKECNSRRSYAEILSDWHVAT